MSSTIEINQLSNAVSKELDNMNKEVIRQFNEITKDAASAAVKELKQTSPKKSGKYAKGWTKKITDKVLGVNHYTIYNKTHYQLIHLLEYGHLGPNGKRQGSAEAKPHVEKVNKDVGGKFIKAVEGIKL